MQSASFRSAPIVKSVYDSNALTLHWTSARSTAASPFQPRLRRRHGQVFERRREGNGHIHRAHALDRRIQIIERAIGDHRGDLGRHAISFVAFVNDDGAAGFLGRFDQRLFVERKRRARVDDFGADADFASTASAAASATCTMLLVATSVMSCPRA